MTRFRCRRDHCDGLTTAYNGLCQYHASPIDEDLHRQRPISPLADPFYPGDAFSDDVPGMSATEKMIHGENE